MQFLVYDPTFDPADYESTEPPCAEAMEEMGNFIAEAYEAGVIVATGALQTTASGWFMKMASSPSPMGRSSS